MNYLICGKTMRSCPTPDMCSPHGDCQPDKSEWQSGYDEGRRMGVKTALDEREQLKSENEALRKDAERYRWLKLQRSKAWRDAAGVPMNHTDAFIDAAMAKERGQ